MRRFAIIAAAAIVAAMTACGGSQSTATTAAATTAAETTKVAETTAAPETTTAAETTAAEAEDPRAALQAELKEKYGVDPSSIRNDATGKWRLSKVANTTPPTEYAVEYAKAYMEQGDIHWIVNFTLKTTTLIRLQIGDIVEAKTTEYVEDEEHDAKIIGDGMLLTDDFYELESGKKIEVEVDEDAGMVDADDLISAVRSAIDGSFGADDELQDISFDGKDLKIKVKLGDSMFEPRDMAIVAISSITDPILDLDDKYYNTWETITIDFGNVGKATMDKSMVKDQGIGKFFDFPDSILK